MSPLVCMPFSHWLAWSAGLLFVVGSACAYSGAKLAIRLCAKQNGCAMRIEREKAQTTQDLTEQLRILREKNPELAAIHEAARRALSDSGTHSVIPERKGETKP